MVKFTLLALAASLLFAVGQAATAGPGVLDHDMDPPTDVQQNDGDVHALFDNHCYPRREATPGKVGGAVDCTNYLKRLGTKECRARKGGTIMCRSGGTIVKGFPNNANTASSYCRDVATAVVWVLDHCPACGGSDCDVAGIAAAGGNGYLVIKVSGI
ncbi:hypothetical protein CISG_00108 [Coccidioides immitis RMSCC 3703]|uniref:Killer toxin Kp4 domain-containing protein n=2 Tax=Coccidioides immitis TaxID=5501 RepID=A0A0J8QKS7_COCIT|nr:hypothetical protein CIRG_07428 [Coccidioides immitis RMSCC 2394]KMU71798.1 hypothetical protein CISG_00108 [Coccidioides immitis RMSCC 3703]